MIFPLTAPMFDFLVLSIISKEDTYGYQISQIIKQASSMKDSTLYPILRRLQEQQCLTTYDQQIQGRNRKYYSITDEGRAYHGTLISEWDCYKKIIDKIVREDINS